METHRICKARNYGESEALDYLVAATVASKNLGCAYVADGKEKLSTSPGRHTVAYKSQMQCNREKQYKHSQTNEIKKGRLFKKNEKKQSTQNKEQREVISYQSGMRLYSTPVPNILEIMKISGINESFIRYILPVGGFSFYASQINGFSISNGILVTSRDVPSYPYEYYLKYHLGTELRNIHCNSQHRSMDSSEPYALTR